MGRKSKDDRTNTPTGVPELVLEQCRARMTIVEGEFEELKTRRMKITARCQFERGGEESSQRQWCRMAEGGLEGLLYREPLRVVRMMIMLKPL